MTKVLKISEDMDTIRVDGVSCIRCGRCVKVCPSQIFVQEKAGGPVALSKPENCIVCGHCVAACPTGSVAHAEFPPAKVHPVDYAAMPTPAQVELLMAARRSNRALSQRPVPQEMLDRIVAAADLAPTATNARQLGYTLVTDPVLLRRMSEYTLGVFGHGGEMPATVPALRHMIQALEENFPNGDYLWGYTQAHREDWEMVKTALDMGASTVRIGFEDSDMIAPGVHVDNNAALIAKVSDIVKSKGMMPMTPDEVRAMLKIPPLRR